jgi:D-sedoheptulose 7-phosphate isomerase
MIKKQLADLADTVERFSTCVSAVESSGKAIVQTLRAGGSIFSCGNGGSCCDAMHLTEELTGRYRANRKALPGFCLSADPSLITCNGNDFGYDDVFARSVEGLVRSGDILVGFTTSGNSENIIRAFNVASAKGATTIALLGKDGGRCKRRCDHEIIVPSDDTARIQELHTFVIHSWLEMVEAESW